MPYFDVYVILPKQEEGMLTVHDLLAPYNEDVDVPPYVLQYRKDAKKLYEEELRKQKERLEHHDTKFYQVELRYYNMLKNMSAEGYFDYITGEQMTDMEGNIISTDNPNGEWYGEYIESENFIIETEVRKELPFALVLPNGAWLDMKEMNGWPIEIEEKEKNEKWRELVTECYKKYLGHKVIRVQCPI